MKFTEEEFEKQFDKICENFVKYELPECEWLIQKCSNCRKVTKKTKIIWDKIEDKEFCSKCKRLITEEEIVDMDNKDL